MRRFAAAFFAVLMLVGISSARAELNIAEVSKRLPPNIFKEASQIPEKPHFLLGLEPQDDEWLQYLEWKKIFQTKDLFYGETGPGLMDKTRENYLAAGSTQLSEAVTISGKTIRVLYTHHHFTKEEMYTFWSRMGEKNLAEFSPLYRRYETLWSLRYLSDTQWQDVERVLGWAQFEAVKSLVHGAMQWAVAKNVKDYGEMNLTEGVIEAQAEILGDPAYRSHLDEMIPGASGTKVRDIIPVPLTRPEDFLPDLVIVGPYGFYGGFANWKTPETERIVFFDVLGLALWYVSKWAMPAHEFVHTNPHLQGTPLDLYYDLEMWADLTTGLDSGMMEFLVHPYMVHIRDLARTVFGYDSVEAKRRIFPGEFGARDVREKEFRENAKRVKEIRDEILRFVKDPKKGFIKRFYTDPYFWTAVNMKYCDTAAVFRLLFTLEYRPAGLFDPDKKDKDGKAMPPVLQTEEWLMKEEEAGRLQRLAKDAMAKTGSKDTRGAEVAPKIEDLTGLTRCPVDSRLVLMTQEEQQQAMEFLKPLLEKARGGDAEARIVLMRIFGGSLNFSSVPMR